MALGATRFNILLQFLVESVALCLFGGVLGIASGAGAATLLSRYAGWQTFVTTFAAIKGMVSFYDFSQLWRAE